MNALSPIRAEVFGPIDPYKQARIAGGMTMRAVQAAQSLLRGDADGALEYLRAGLEQYDAEWADFVWPRITPPALSEADMAELIAGDDAADRRQAAWETAKAIAERNGGEA